jgi:hypothetical protein
VIATLIALAVLVPFVAFAAVCAHMLLSYPPAPLPGSVMSAREQALVGAVADAFFPPGGPIPISGREADVPRYFDGYLRRSARTQAFLLRLLFAFTELSPLLFGPRRARFTRLTPEEQIAFLDGAFQSSIYFRRVAFISFRAVMTMAYLAHDGVARHMRMTADTDPFQIGARVLERPLHLPAGSASPIRPHPGPVGAAA